MSVILTGPITRLELPQTCLNLPFKYLKLMGDLLQIMSQELLSSMAMTARQRQMRLYTQHSRRRGKRCRLSRSLCRAAAKGSQKSERLCNSIRQQVWPCWRFPSICCFDSQVFLLQPAGHVLIVCSLIPKVTVCLSCTTC